jgi:hypothetical protein
MLFPEINPSDWEMISEFQPKKHYLITPIKRTLENKTPQQTVFF